MSPQQPPRASYSDGQAWTLTRPETAPPPYPVIDPEPSYWDVVRNINQPTGWFQLVTGAVVGGLVGVRAGQTHLRYGFANHIRKHWYGGLLFGTYLGFTWAAIESERRLRGLKENDREARYFKPTPRPEPAIAFAAIGAKH